MADNNQNWNDSSWEDRNRYRGQQIEENWNRRERNGYYGNQAGDQEYRRRQTGYNSQSDGSNTQRNGEDGWQRHSEDNYNADKDRNRRQGSYEHDNDQSGAAYGGQYGAYEDRRRYSQSNNYQDNTYNDYPTGQRNRQDWGGARVNTGNYDNGFFEDNQAGEYGRYSGRREQYNTRGQNYGHGHRYQHSHNDRNRDWWDRTRDEVSSWFGDDDAERRRRMDHIAGGGHRGKGPKDYRRSEDRIREDVCDRLTEDDYLDASNVQVQIQGEEVILTGTVSSREQKRRAEDIVESVSGVRNVENRLKVNYNNTSDMIRENGRSAGSAEIGQ